MIGGKEVNVEAVIGWATLVLAFVLLMNSSSEAQVRTSPLNGLDSILISIVCKNDDYNYEVVRDSLLFRSDANFGLREVSKVNEPSKKNCFGKKIVVVELLSPIGDCDTDSLGISACSRIIVSTHRILKKGVTFRDDYEFNVVSTNSYLWVYLTNSGSPILVSEGVIVSN